MLDFAGQVIRPLTKSATITQTLISYRLSLKLNLDILQSLYRVGIQVFTSPRPGTQHLIFRVSTRDWRAFHRHRGRFQEGHSSRYCLRIFQNSHLLRSPGITHWQHPSFFAYFPTASTFEGILGELYSSSVSNPGFNVGAPFIPLARITQ